MRNVPPSEGILNLNKPPGPTSHDIVGRVRALTGIRRVGHTGTLDPLADGVLVVCVGRATRVVEYLMAGQKVYRARVRLGITTDTYDAEGQVVAEVPGILDMSGDQVEVVLDQFRGTITQVPPAYSAIKHKGTSLHRLARQGVEVEEILRSKARQVDIFRLELIAWNPPECVLEVTCSPGTYIRSLAHDLGKTLGCGAHLIGLTRTASGKFRLEDTLTLKTLAQAADEGRWSDLLQPMDAVLTHFPALYLDADAARRICSGQPVKVRERKGVEKVGKDETPAHLARAYGPGGMFLALVTYVPKDDMWQPHKVFADASHIQPDSDQHAPEL
ncbi:MAG: tRNA pseudouridine(55) synthase TruB [Chloroflexi bacterium]|nr:tRNA pseudouridine(55) synthase TruB [Chloroflexota bacterium]